MGQGIRLNNSKNNIIDDNSILTGTYLFILDVKSVMNNFIHNFIKFPGNVHNLDSKTNCSMHCERHDMHKLSCLSHLENKMDCMMCTSCDKIGMANDWRCI